MDSNDVKNVEACQRATAEMMEEIGKVIVGQRRVVELFLTSLLARGHGLFIGVPGLAKTLLVSTVAEVLDLTFNRIQFTPDLMPSDIIGTEVLEEGESRRFRFIRGPVFSNILLADEINRTPPKTQSALLQAMQELRVTAGGKTYPIEAPFLVLATQNPIEQEGTYPLPEAQLDRFMFSIHVGYPSKEEEQRVVVLGTRDHRPELKKILKPEDILAFQNLVARVPIADSLIETAVMLARMSRPSDEAATPFIRDYVRWGSGPRGGMFIVLAAKARAVIQGRYHVSFEDIETVARPVLQHRIIPNFKAESDRIESGMIVDHLIEEARRLAS